MHALSGQLIPKRKKEETALSIPRFSFKINQVTLCRSWRGIREGEENPEKSHLKLEGKISKGRTILSSMSESCSLSTTVSATLQCARHWNQE